MWTVDDQRQALGCPVGTIENCPGSDIKLCDAVSFSVIYKHHAQCPDVSGADYTFCLSRQV